MGAPQRRKWCPPSDDEGIDMTTTTATPQFIAEAVAFCEGARSLPVRGVRAGRPFALLVADMDALKDFNRDEGFTAGNDALRRLALLSPWQPLPLAARPGVDRPSGGGLPKHRGHRTTSRRPESRSK